MPDRCAERQLRSSSGSVCWLRRQTVAIARAAAARRTKLGLPSLRPSVACDAERHNVVSDSRPVCPPSSSVSASVASTKRKNFKLTGEMTSWAHETTHYDLHVSLGTVLVEAVALIPKLTHLFMAEGGWLVAELTVAALLAGGVVEEVAVLKVAWQIHNLRVALLPLLHSRCNGVRVYSLQVDRVENLAFFVGAMTFGGGMGAMGSEKF